MANGKERASAILLKLSAAIAGPSPHGDGGSRWPRGGKTEYKVFMVPGMLIKNGGGVRFPGRRTMQRWPLEGSQLENSRRVKTRDSHQTMGGWIRGEEQG